jgi:hypothetical protein
VRESAVSGDHDARAMMDSFVAKSTFVVGERGKTYLAAYLVGVFGTFGLIRLAHSPDWLSTASFAGSLVSGAVAGIFQKKLDAMSVSLGRIMTAILVGLATVVLPTLLSYWHAQHTDLDARGYITADHNISMNPGKSALFIVDVPSHRDYLTVKFAATLSPGSNENCINGASLILVQNFGATVSDSSTNEFGSDYTVEIPFSVGRFTLSATFIPQSGFEVCASDVTVTSARFHD